MAIAPPVKNEAVSRAETELDRFFGQLRRQPTVVQDGASREMLANCIGAFKAATEEFIRQRDTVSGEALAMHRLALALERAWALHGELCGCGEACAPPAEEDGRHVH